MIVEHLDKIKKINTVDYTVPQKVEEAEYSANPTNQYGFSIELSSDESILTVGYPAAAEARGSVSVYKKNELGLFQKSSAQGLVTYPDYAKNYYFGYASSLSPNGKILAISAIWADSPHNYDAGALWLYEVFENGNSGYRFQILPYPNDVGATGGMGFGCTLGITPDSKTLIIGQHNLTHGGVNHCGALRFVDITDITNPVLLQTIEGEGTDYLGKIGGTAKTKFETVQYNTRLNVFEIFSRDVDGVWFKRTSFPSGVAVSVHDPKINYAPDDSFIYIYLNGETRKYNATIKDGVETYEYDSNFSMLAGKAGGTPYESENYLLWRTADFDGVNVRGKTEIASQPIVNERDYFKSSTIPQLTDGRELNIVSKPTLESFIKTDTITDPLNRDATNSYGFGLEMSGDGNCLAVGEYLATPEPALEYLGRVHIYRKNNDIWVYLTAVESPVNERQLHFGWSIALNYDGTQLAVGSNKRASDTSFISAVHFFNLVDDNYINTGTLALPESGVHNGIVGQGAYDLALTGDGSNLFVAGGQDPWVTQYSRGADGTYGNPVKFTGPTSGHEAVSCTADGKRVLVGFPREPVEQLRHSVGIFTLQDDGSYLWSGYLVYKNHPVTGVFAGSGVGISGNGEVIVVGAQGTHVNGGTVYGGTFYIFTISEDGTQWEMQDQYVVPDTADNNNWGRTIAINYEGTEIAIGSLASAVWVAKCINEDPKQGYVFGSKWPFYFDQKLTKPLSGDAVRGTRVAVSPNGKWLAEGRRLDEKVFIYAKRDGLWVYSHAIVQHEVGGFAFGHSLTFNSDGTKLFIGSCTVTSNRGVFYGIDVTEKTTEKAFIRVGSGVSSPNIQYFGSGLAYDYDLDIIVAGSECSAAGEGRVYFKSPITGQDVYPVLLSYDKTAFMFGRTVAYLGDGHVLISAKKNSVATTDDTGLMYLAKYNPTLQKHEVIQTIYKPERGDSGIEFAEAIMSSPGSKTALVTERAAGDKYSLLHEYKLIGSKLVHMDTYVFHGVVTACDVSKDDLIIQAPEVHLYDSYELVKEETTVKRTPTKSPHGLIEMSSDHLISQVLLPTTL